MFSGELPVTYGHTIISQLHTFQKEQINVNLEIRFKLLVTEKISKHGFFNFALTCISPVVVVGESCFIQFWSLSLDYYVIFRVYLHDVLLSIY